jgi:hypothetical protein
MGKFQVSQPHSLGWGEALNLRLGFRGKLQEKLSGLRLRHFRWAGNNMAHFTIGSEKHHLSGTLVIEPHRLIAWGETWNGKVPVSLIEKAFQKTFMEILSET